VSDDPIETPSPQLEPGRTAPGAPVPEPARTTRPLGRWNAVLAGMILDGVDFMTAGPIGLYGGFILGAAAGWWAAREFGFDRRGRMWMALAGAIYSATPATEFLPLGTLAGALVRLGPPDERPAPDLGATSDPERGGVMFLSRFQNEVYAAFRFVTGFLFLFHGSQKLFDWPPSGMVGEIPAFIIYVSGPIEFFGGLMVMLGFMAGWAAFVCSGLMAAAYWMAHGTASLLPIQNGGEAAALYCFAFLFIAARGSGIWSVDAARGA